ncbi:MAG: hypothetical protein SGJ24_13550 [Chloroflexota bacterium]|nr:hypothetical protein [Chloroflexota bacterium]
MTQESRTLLAVTFLLAALFVVMNLIVQAAPIGEWGLALVLIVVGVVLALSTRIDLASGRTVAEVAAERDSGLPMLPRQQVYEFAAPTTPQLAAMMAAPALAASLNGAAVIGDVAVEEDSLLPIEDASSVSAQSAAPDLALDAVSADEPAPPPLDDEPASGT